MSAVDLLLTAGLSSNELNARRSTPLHIAALKGHREIAALLLAHGADPNAANMGGSTPLHAAVEIGQHELAELLVSSGADASSPSGLLSPENAAPRMIAATAPACSRSQCRAPPVAAIAKRFRTRRASVGWCLGEGSQPLKMALGQGDAGMLAPPSCAAALSPRLSCDCEHGVSWSGMLCALLGGGAALDGETVQAAFWTAARLAEQTADGGLLPEEVPRLLHHVFDADFAHLQGRRRLTHNVTCRQPAEHAPKTRSEHEPGLRRPRRPRELAPSCHEPSHLPAGTCVVGEELLGGGGTSPEPSRNLPTGTASWTRSCSPCRCGRGARALAARAARRALAAHLLPSQLHLSRGSAPPATPCPLTSSTM